VVDQRSAAHGLQTFGAENTDDFGGIAVQLGAACDQRLAGGDGTAGGRVVTRYGRFRFEDVLITGKIEGVNAKQAGGGIEKGQAGVIVMNDALEGGDDATKSSGNSRLVTRTLLISRSTRRRSRSSDSCFW